MKEGVSEAVEIGGRGTNGVYITVDIEVFDSSLASGTGDIAFGGITLLQLLEGIEVPKQAHVMALDWVEVAPNSDPSGVTERLAIQAILNYIAPRIFANS